MENSDLPPSRKSSGFFHRAFDVLSGFGVATISLLLLGLLTWFATLEQIDNGLYPTLGKYFDHHWRAMIVIPEINGKIVPFPMPSGYWVGAVLLVNLILGGIIRIRRGWRVVGVVISHFGIVFMLIAGGVSHHFSERGNMPVREGETANAAEDYFEYVVEVSEIKDGKAEEIHVIRGKYLTDLTDATIRTFRFPDLPFDLQVGGYLGNAQPVGVAERAPSRGEEIVDNYYLVEKPNEDKLEENTAACQARILHKDGTPGVRFLLAGASFHPFTVRQDDRIFTIDMRKRLWAMPFDLRLDQFNAEFHPGTSRPAKFVSQVTRLENGGEAKVTIQMNEPMRYEGLTFFQASYGPPGAGPNDKMYSVFEVVKNPADKWPEYSLYIVTLGLLIHFVMKLVSFLGSSSRKKRHV
jgi:hypothetical protein